MTMKYNITKNKNINERIQENIPQVLAIEKFCLLEFLEKLKNIT
jgi:hypothetical protein